MQPAPRAIQMEKKSIAIWHRRYLDLAPAGAIQFDLYLFILRQL